MTCCPKFLLVTLLVACLPLVGCGRDKYNQGYAAGEKSACDKAHSEGKIEGLRIVGQKEAAAHAKGLADGRRQGKDEGYKTGQDDGYAKGRKDGKHEGYEIGFKTAKPGAGVPLTGFWRVVFHLSALVGAAAVLGSLLLLMRLLIHDSHNAGETWGKRIAAGFAWRSCWCSITAFRTRGMHPDSSGRCICCLPARDWKLLWIGCAALATDGFSPCWQGCQQGERRGRPASHDGVSTSADARPAGRVVAPSFRAAPQYLPHLACGSRRTTRRRSFVMRHLLAPVQDLDYPYGSHDVPTWIRNHEDQADTDDLHTKPADTFNEKAM